MAFTAILRGSNKIPALTNAVSKLLASHSMNSNLVLTPIMARNFTALNRPVLFDNQKSVVSTQKRTSIVSHSSIWAMEKYVSAALVLIIPFCVAYPSPLNDNILAFAVVAHMHWGVEAVVVDYVRPVLFGATIPVISRMLVYLISAMTLGGLMYFNFNDVGISQAVRKFWSIKH